MGQILAGMAQHPEVELGYQTVGFGNTNETLRAEQAMLRMLPANQRLELCHLPGVQIENRLVVDA
ncbi:hypothetical protein D3C78_1758270 [compost metagenome]